MEKRVRTQQVGWREGVVVNVLKKSDKAGPGKYREISLLSTVVGKTFCNVLKYRMGAMMEKEDELCEGQAAFRLNRSCADHGYTFGKILQGRIDAGLITYCFALDVQKAYHILWRNGMAKTNRGIEIRRKMWRMLKI